jgi:hypothetical protein
VPPSLIPGHLAGAVPTRAPRRRSPLARLERVQPQTGLQLERLIDAYQRGALQVEELQARRDRLDATSAAARARAEKLAAREMVARGSIVWGRISLPSPPPCARAVFAVVTAGPSICWALRRPEVLRRRMNGGPTAEPDPRQKIIVAGVYLWCTALLVVSALDRRSGSHS